MSLRFRVVFGVPSLTFKIKALGDMSNATLPVMMTQFTTGDAAGFFEATWTQRGNGTWILRLEDYQCPLSCDLN